MIGQVAVRAAELIERKRNGAELSEGEIADLVLGFTRGEIPDYQMAAWCMAVYFKGLSGRETHSLTDAMIRSGETLDLGTALGRRVVDKHSTGGVGDKTSLAVGPIVAACGVPFGKMSGRGLGHTGGTLDKLESIPGFRVELTIDEFVQQVREVGLAIIGQTGDLVPADKKLYALRDVTATVDIVPLIASSIMSKKLAAGADAIVLDVKVGDGAFMKTLEDARALAEQMVDLGRRRGGRWCVCSPTWISPSGRRSETRSRCERQSRRSRATGHPTSRSWCWTPARACSRSRIWVSMRPRVGAGPRSRSRTARRSPRTSAGSVRRAAIRIARRCSRAPVVREVRAPRGFVVRLGASAIGHAALELGAGRRTKDDEIDHAVGVVCRGSAATRRRRGACSPRSTRRDESSAVAAIVAVRRRTRSETSCRRSTRILLDVVGAAMPELPEVETIRRARAAPRGRTLIRVEIVDPRLTRPDDPCEVAAELEGDRVVAVERRGKYLLLRLDSGSGLLVHLRMTGSFGFAPGLG